MNEQVSQIWEQYKQGLSYQQSQGYTKNWPMYERFRAGDQWPAMTDKTRNLPRPVFNIIEQVELHKISSVMAEQIKIIYKTQDATDNEQMAEAQNVLADNATKFAEKVWEDIKQDQLNEEMLEDASNRGTGILHYYFDTSKMGGVEGSQYIGEIAGEAIDPINIFFGNPNSSNLQKQPYIIISSRELVSEVKKQAKANGLDISQTDLITADSDTEAEGYDIAKKEMDGIDKVTVLTKYYKENGKVMFSKTTQNAIVKPPTQTEMTLYPLALMNWKKKKKSIFGQGDAEGMIANQRAINLLFALQLLSVQLTSFPKLLVKQGALKKAISNEIGEIITDYTPPGQGDGIKYMQPANIPGIVQSLTENFIQLTKDINGANEHALGETKTSDLNATAISLLQKASGIPLESIKRRFYSLVEDVGRIYLDMFQAYYNTPRKFEYTDDDNEQEVGTFNGEDLQGVNMSLKVDVGASTVWNEGNTVEMLGNLMQREIIDQEQYVKFMPKNLLPFKDELLKALRERAEAEAQAAAKDEEYQIRKLMAQLTPQEQAAFDQLPPEEQNQAIEEMMEAQAMEQQMMQAQ